MKLKFADGHSEYVCNECKKRINEKLLSYSIIDAGRLAVFPWVEDADIHFCSMICLKAFLDFSVARRRRAEQLL